MGTHYPYYHCSKGCKERQKASIVNNAFLELLKTIQFKPTTLKLFSAIVKEKIKKNNQDEKAELDSVHREINKQKQRLANAKAMMLDGEITANEFKEIRYEIEEKITQLTCDLSNISTGIQNLDDKVDDVVELLIELKKTYQQMDTVTKQHIVCSIFPGKLMYEEKTCRTLEVNKVIPLIASMDKAFIEDKKRKHTNFGVLSRGVETKDILSNTFILDINRLATFSRMILGKKYL